MFALLEHETAAPPAALSPTTPDSIGVARATSAGVHWDFLIEGLVYERLPTWRLAMNPLTTRGPIPAEPLPDHRRLYLDYEGELTGGRGRVRRLDRGPAQIERFAHGELVVQLEGGQLRGTFCIRRSAAGGLVFAAAAPGPQQP